MLVVVEAVSLRNATVVAVAVPARGSYSMSVPRGPYLVIVRVSDLRAGRTITRTSQPVLVKSSPRTVNLSARSASASLRARAANAGGPVIGIGEIPIKIDIPGYTPGGSVENGIINGLLPSCQAGGRRLLDVTRQVRDAIKTEQKLSDEGRTAVKFQLNPLTPDLVIQGQVSVDSNGKAIADIKVVDPKTGKVVDHIVVAGEPGVVDGTLSDLGPFLRQLGTGIGSRECQRKPTPKPKPKPKPGPPPPPPSPNVNTLAYSGTLDGFSAIGTSTTVTVHVAWTEEATSPSSDPSTVTWRLSSLTGTFKQKSGDPGASCSADLSIKAGADSVFSPGISHLPGQSAYTLQANSPAYALDGSSSPAAYQIQSSDPNTAENCGSPAQMLRLVENPAAASSSSGAAMVDALNPKTTVSRGHSDTPFNFPFSQPDSLGAHTLSIISTISFFGT